MQGKSECVERTLQTRRFIDVCGKHHDGAFIEDHLRVKSEFPNRFQYNRVVRRPRRDDDPADVERRHRFLSQAFDEPFVRRRAEKRLFASARIEEQAAVFSDDHVERVDVRKHALEVREDAPGNENRAPPRFA